MNINNIFIALRLLIILILLNFTVVFAKSPAIIEPCDLIIQKEAEDIMGEKMKAGQVREQVVTGQKLCLYEAADEASFAMLQVSLIQDISIPDELKVSGQSAQNIFKETKKNFPAHETIDGIGDDAFIATPGIHILEKGYYLCVAAGNLNQNRDKVLVAGEKAVANLESALK